MVSNNKEKEVFHEQKYLNPEKPRSNTFTRLSQYLAQTQLEAAVLGISKSSVSVFSKDGNINQPTINDSTLLEEFLILWLHGVYGLKGALIDFIEYINFLINQNACFTDELNIQIQQDISKEISDFIEPIDDSKCTVIGYQKENVIFTNISNARLKMGKLLKSDFCHKNYLSYCHFNINGNKGYAQKYNDGMRNYVIYRGCINMRANWNVASLDENSSQIIKKESIDICIRDNGTVRLSKQDELRHKKGEINFNGCRVLIGGYRLEDVLSKRHWLYSDSQIFSDSAYCSNGTTPERKISMPDSNNSDLVNLDTYKVNQENNENLVVYTDTEQSQFIDLEDSLSTNTSDFSLVMNLIDEASNNIAEIGKEKRVEKEGGKMEEESEEFLQGLNSELSKGRKDNYKIAYGISVDNSQMSLERSNQSNNVTASNTGSLNNQYYEDMDIEVLATIGNASNSQDKVAEWLSNQPNNNNVRSRKDSSNTTTSNSTLSPGESDRSSVNSLSWDDNTLDLNDNDIELGYNPPRRTRSFNSKYRSSSVPTRLNISREVPNNNPSYNFNKSYIYSIVQDPNENITKLGIFLI